MRDLTLRLLVCLFWCSAFAAAQEAERENSVRLDLYAFRQNDDDGAGGDPRKAEGFDYWALRLGVKLRLSEEVVGKLNGTLAYIDNDDQVAFPTSIVNANTTSASADIATLDSLLVFDIKRKDSAWTWSPGLFYHHQDGFVSFGLDFGGSRELADGVSEFAFHYAFRFDYLFENWWDGTNRGTDERLTSNLLLSYSRILSPRWRGTASVQYARMDGLLSDTFNFVTQFNAAGTPIRFGDERLPRTRNRVQLNARARYAIREGQSAGLDMSFYFDDWGIQHFAAEPSFETTFGPGWRWRVWWRVSAQSGTKYFVRRPLTNAGFQTQDSDLGSWSMHSPGTSLTIPVRRSRKKDTDVVASAFGFRRSDGVDGIGGKIGFVVRW